MLRVCVLTAVLILISGDAFSAEMRGILIDDRMVDLYEPENTEGTPLPMIIVLHGGAGSASGMAKHIGLQKRIGTYAFRVAYLNATRHRRDDGKNARYWNDEACCGENLRPDVDDSAYIARVISALKDDGLVAGEKIALVGHSNGAKMAYLVVCEHGDLVSALVAISGAQKNSNCVNLQGTRVLNIHGAKDKRVPLAGGISRRAPDIHNDLVIDAGTALQAKGATFQMIVVPDAGHKLDSLDRGLPASTGSGLADTILEFIFLQPIDDQSIVVE